MRLFELRPVRTFALAFIVFAASAAEGQLRRSAPTAMSDAEFWDFFTSSSERGGTFASENFVSNEMTFQHVVPTLLRTVTKDGVYLGVGPEQNFTYIANLKPRMAVIFDIRRQNAMAHLMYKALFESSPTRAEFVERLFSRPTHVRLTTSAKAAELFTAVAGALPSDSAYKANGAMIFRSLVDQHHFVLTPGDSAAIEHVYEVFFEAGPDINYGYRLGRMGTTASTYPSYGMLQTAMNADSVPMAFLATEENYRTIRDMHLRNMIVPVVGDFAGPKAIRTVGEYLRQRGLVVSAFYLSNVEQYLFQNGVANDFYENVRTLPVDSGSTFVRSVPGMGSGPNFSMSGGFVVQRMNGSVAFNGNGGQSVIPLSGITSIRMIDSAGVRQIHIFRDSAGQQIVSSYRDSAGTMIMIPADSATARSRSRADSSWLASMRAVRDTTRVPFAIARPSTVGATMGSYLTSGLAPILGTLDQVSAGKIRGYQDIITMTKTSGWKQ